jgi:purine-cytosine permease-like protein
MLHFFNAQETNWRQKKNMFKKSTEYLFGAACYFGVAGGLCAISFLGEFAVPVSVDAAPQRPWMHASAVEVTIPPAIPAVTKE